MDLDSSLVVDVGTLAISPGTSKDLEITAVLPGLEVGMGEVDGEIHADLLLESLVEGILVSGRVEGRYRLECSRCLREFTAPFSVPVNEVYAYPEQPEFEEGFVVLADTIDLAPMIRDEVLLALPSNPLHDEACRGLCATCGEDLNERDCGHEHEPVDIRWEPLRKLQDEGELG